MGTILLDNQILAWEGMGGVEWRLKPFDLRKTRSFAFGYRIGYLHGSIISQDDGRLCPEVEVFDLVFRYFSE